MGVQLKLRGRGLLVHKYFYFFAPNTHFALVVALQSRKKVSTIQYGYRKCGNHARLFSQTLAHGNSKNEIRQMNRGRGQEERREYGKK